MHVSGRSRWNWMDDRSAATAWSLLLSDTVERGPARTSAAALAKEYSAVRKQLNAYVEKLPQKDRDADAEKIRVFPMIRTSFGTIRRIGDDFVLIELEGEAKQRRVLPKSKIGHIDLDGQAVRFYPPREARPENVR